jgi:hypothetical protein
MFNDSIAFIDTKMKKTCLFFINVHT